MSVYSQFLDNPSQTINDEGGLFGPSTAASQNVLGTYVQVVASTAHTVRNILVVAQSNGTTQDIRVAIAAGGAGAEVVKANIYAALASAATPATFTVIIPVDPSLFPKGTRMAVAVANMTNNTTPAIGMGITLQEAND